MWNKLRLCCNHTHFVIVYCCLFIYTDYNAALPNVEVVEWYEIVALFWFLNVGILYRYWSLY